MSAASFHLRGESKGMDWAGADGVEVVMRETTVNSGIAMVRRV